MQMKTIGKRVNMATSLLGILTLGLGRNPPAAPYGGTAENWRAPLFDLLGVLPQMGWSWGNSWWADVPIHPPLTSLGRGRDIFERVPNSTWSIKSFWAVWCLRDLCLCFPCRLMGTDWGGFRGTGRVGDWVKSDGYRVVWSPWTAGLESSFANTHVKESPHWKNTKQDLADVAGNC